jgi:small-conductance mechanosensitive channel
VSVLKRVLLVGGASLLAATASYAADGDGPARDSMPLKVANRTIIVLRGPIAGFSARERVVRATQRIEQLLGAGATAVTVEPFPDGATRVMVGGKHAFLVTSIDIDPSAGETTALVAAGAATRLEDAIVERREQASPGYLARAASLALAVTLAAALALWLLIRLHRWARRRVTDATNHASNLALHGVDIGLGQVLRVTRTLPAIISWLLGLLLGWGWLSFVLTRFPYTRPWGEQLGADLLGLLKDITLSIVEALPGLLVVAVVLILARAVNRAAKYFFDQVERRHLELGWLDAETAAPTRRIASVVVWVFALAMAYPYLPGAQTDAFKGLSVLLGLMVSLGAASIVGQAFAGLIIMYTRPFRVGDYVRIGAVEGTVIELGMFMSRIRTGLGTEITLPNTAVMAGGATNYSRVVKGAGFVVDVAVTIGYSTPWRQVHAMLLEAARRTGELATTPAPEVRQTALSDFYVEYRLIAYAPIEQPRARAEVLSDLHASVQDVFNEHGVQIMSPHYMLDPKEPQVVPKERWFSPPAKPPEKS